MEFIEQFGCPKNSIAIIENLSSTSLFITDKDDSAKPYFSSKYSYLICGFIDFTDVNKKLFSHIKNNSSDFIIHYDWDTYEKKRWIVDKIDSFFKTFNIKNDGSFFADPEIIKAFFYFITRKFFDIVIKQEPNIDKNLLIKINNLQNIVYSENNYSVEYYRMIKQILDGYIQFISDNSKIFVIKSEYEQLTNKLEENNIDIFLPHWKPYFDAVKKTVEIAEMNLEANIFIYGNSGVGKEKFSEILHKLSNRSEIPLCSLNASAFPENLIEAELFGYEKGAHTDAKATKKGLIEMAHNGFLFLDEIADISYNCQTKLLRAIQEKVIRRNGGVKDIPVNVIFISASNKNLELEIQNKNMREDFYYRMNSIQIDIPVLSEYFWLNELEYILEYFCRKQCYPLITHINKIKDFIINNEKNKSNLLKGNFRYLQSLLLNYRITLNKREQVILKKWKDDLSDDEKNLLICRAIENNITEGDFTDYHKIDRTTPTQHLKKAIDPHLTYNKLLKNSEFVSKLKEKTAITEI